MSAHRLIQPKVEAEVAFVIGRDLDDERLTIADISRAIEFALPAIEIVDSRIADWKIGILDTIADNASSGLYVLGATPKKLEGLDLRLAGMMMEHLGEPVSVGAGAACLGDPLSAMLWLAKTMARVGRPLKAGDTVLSGALGPMVPVAWGDVYEARIEGLGSVRAAFAKESTDMGKIQCAIIGSGNIGTDLMIKVMRMSDTLEMGAMVGIDPNSDGLARAARLGVATTHEGIEGLRKLPNYRDIKVVFDATSAGAHIQQQRRSCRATARR